MPHYAASKLVTGPFDEAVVRDTATHLRGKLDGKPTFGMVFVTPDYADKANDLLELIRVYGHVPTLIGCSGNGLVGVLQKQGDLIKVQPIIDWTDRMVFEYLKKHELPYHPLWEQGYVSIGDVHTTRPLTANMTEEETRFFGLKRECGLHIGENI